MYLDFEKGGHHLNVKQQQQQDQYERERDIYIHIKVIKAVYNFLKFT